MLACISSAILHGVRGTPVEVEVHVAQSALPGFNIVGLPDGAVRESRDRVRAALVTSGLKWPNRKVTVNLARSGVKKGGVWLDLPIAIGVAVASDQLEPGRVEGFAFVGELGLDGSLRSVPGVVPLAASLSARKIVVPSSCASEAALVAGERVRATQNLEMLLRSLRGEGDWGEVVAEASQPPAPVPDLGEVRG